jgi:hypothetical protein
MTQNSPWQAQNNSFPATLTLGAEPNTAYNLITSEQFEN